MKVVIGSIAAATAASACCLGPVVFSLVGAGALGATAVRLEPLRPVFLALTGGLLLAGFYFSSRSTARAACGTGGRCRPYGAGRTLLWIATGIVILIAMFPYYMTWFI